MTRRLDGLTGLRFVAAAWVFGFHATYLCSGALGTWMTRVFGRGASGVGLFFVLSGFVLAWSSRPADTARAVWRRRGARILPNYLVAWVLAGLGSVWLLAGQVPWRAGAAGLLLVQSWVPRPSIYFGWNGPAWSLSCEVFFYALLPFLLPRIARLSRAGRLRVAAVALALSGALALVAVIGSAPQPSLFDSRFGVVGWLVYICPLARLPEFVLGLICALLVRDRQVGRVPVGAAVAVVVGAYAASYAIGWFVVQVALMALPFALLVTALAQRELARPDAPGWLGDRALVVLGEWSYALYLTHHLLLQLAQKWLGRPLGGAGGAGGAGWLLLLLAVAVAVAGVMFCVVERPAERRLRDAPPRVMLTYDAAADRDEEDADAVGSGAVVSQQS